MNFDRFCVDLGCGFLLIFHGVEIVFRFMLMAHLALFSYTVQDPRTSDTTLEQYTSSGYGLLCLKQDGRADPDYIYSATVVGWPKANDNISFFFENIQENPYCP